MICRNLQHTDFSLSLLHIVRQNLIQEAINEAIARTAAREHRNMVVAQENKEKLASPRTFHKHLKKASKLATKIGTAHLQYEDMVRRAERKILEKQRQTEAATQTAKEKANAVAHILFHEPGSILTSQEIVHLWQEAGCQDAREVPRCNFRNVRSFRTIDGTCNNLANPLFGAAGTLFKRLVPAQYEDGKTTLRGNLQNNFNMSSLSPLGPPNPSARHVSETIIRDIDKEETPFTHILMQWGQFLDHDLDLSPELETECEGCELTDICEPIRVGDIDEVFGEHTPNDGDCLPLRRSLSVCPVAPPLSFEFRDQLNDITSYIDGSMVYGSNDILAKDLRQFVGGRLLVGPNIPANQPSLPTINSSTAEFIACPPVLGNTCFLCGDARCNEQISLTVMHTIWVREHNRCARRLASINGHWDDERIYQECRRIVGALIQKITYKDYLIKVFGQENYDIYVGPYRGYNPNIDASVPNSFATAAYRYGHSLIRPLFARLDVNYQPLSIGPLDLGLAFFSPSQYNASLGTDPLARGWVSEISRRMDEFMNSVLTSRLFEPTQEVGFDLASLNIQRGRDHGLPPYLIYRNFCQKIFGVAARFENDLTAARFLNIYGGIDTIDLFPGGLSEERLEDSLIGPTFACIFGITFAGVRDGDRFYYERPRVFTRRQRREIERHSLSAVLCDNLDELRTIQPDAFLGNESRVSCDTIPRLDFRVFRERPCYFRIRVRPRRVRTFFNYFSNVNDTRNFAFHNEFFSASGGIKCGVIECPRQTNQATFIGYTNRRSTTTVRVNSNLLADSGGSVTRGAFRATLTTNLFFSSGSRRGLYTTENECLATTNGQPAFIIEDSSAEAISQQDTPTTPSPDDEGDTVPDDVLQFLEESENMQDEASASVEEEMAEEVKVDNMALPDSALIEELESALKNLKK